MNALHPSKQPVRSSKHLRSRLSQSAAAAQHGYQTRALEILVMLSVNILLSTTAIVALTQLISYQKSQQEKLQQMRSQVNIAQERVSQVREQFDRNFDPQQARQIMQEQTNRIDPQQRPVVWIRSDNETKN